MGKDEERSRRGRRRGERGRGAGRDEGERGKEREQTEGGRGQGEDEEGKSMAQEGGEAGGDRMKTDQMRGSGKERWREIELKSSMLGGSGDAMPADKASASMDMVARSVNRVDTPIHVEGFTGGQPISTVQCPPNWELSSARSDSSVRMLAMDGVNP
ncbi:flagellar motor protein MotD, partial [Pseudomonas syringae]